MAADIRRSYADPAGAVYETPRGYSRRLRPETINEYERLIASKFLREAVADGLLPAIRAARGSIAATLHEK